MKEGYDGSVCEEDYADGFLLGIGWMPEEVNAAERVGCRVHC